MLAVLPSTYLCFFVTIPRMNIWLETIINDVKTFAGQDNSLKNILSLIILAIIAYFIGKYLAAGVIFIARQVARKSDNSTNEDWRIRYRQIETYLSIFTALLRAVVTGIAIYIGFRIISPTDKPSGGLAAIGAGTFFVVFAGQAIASVLRDVTAGTLMIAEGWFNVGDFIELRPMNDVRGVVERFTLRSTKIRSLTGEVIWVHNQYISAVRVTPRGVHTITVDVFMSDLERGRAELRKIIQAIPVGPTLLAKPIAFVEEEKWGDNLYRISVRGQMTPGREWLMNKFLIGAITSFDDNRAEGEPKLFTYEPMFRFTDPASERKFRRAVRVRSDEK